MARRYHRSRDQRLLRAGRICFVCFIAGERGRSGVLCSQRHWTAALYDFVRFGIKQGWACLFGGIAMALVIGDLALLSARMRCYRATIFSCCA